MKNSGSLESFSGLGCVVQLCSLFSLFHLIDFVLVKGMDCSFHLEVKISLIVYQNLKFAYLPQHFSLQHPFSIIHLNFEFPAIHS